jgi:C-terminal processing protease CtpA/Prc
MRTTALLRRKDAMRHTVLCAVLFVLALALTPCSPAQSLTSLRKIDIQTGHEMVKVLRAEVHRNFIDPGCFGVNIEERFAAADRKLEQAQTLAQVFGIVAQPLFDLNDPHTFFIPPPRNARLDYGFQLQMIGDTAFVVAVRPFSDAEKKGLKPGDEVLSVNGYTLTRGNIWKHMYINYIVRPGQTPALVVKGLDGKERKLAPESKVIKNHPVLNFDVSSNGKLDTVKMVNWVLDEARLRKQKHEDVGDVMIWKAPDLDMDRPTLHGFMGSARKKSSLIIDLRENVGGHEEILEELAGYFVEQETKICDFEGRRAVAPLTARGRSDGFKGKLIVLIDSKSSGAAELFARFIQLQKRGTVIGDVSAGAVFRARLHRFDLGESPFAASISEAAPVMSDGVCIERQGVTPDEFLLPTADDLANANDPVLSRAVTALGGELDPAKAGSLFPVEWHRDLLKE